MTKPAEKIEKLFSPEDTMNDYDLKINGFVAAIFTNRFFAISKSTKKKKCMLCEAEKVKKIYGDGSGNSTLVKHVQNTHPNKTYLLSSNDTDLTSSKNENNSDNNMEKPSSDREEVKDVKYPIEKINSNNHRLNKPLPTSPRTPFAKKTIIQCFQIENEKKILEDFAKLQAVHSLPKQLFESKYFLTALQSYRLFCYRHGG